MNQHNQVTAAEIEALSPALRRWVEDKAGGVFTLPGSIALRIERDLEWIDKRNREDCNRQMRYARSEHRLCMKFRSQSTRFIGTEKNHRDKALGHLQLAEKYGPLSKQQQAEAANMRKDLGV